MIAISAYMYIADVNTVALTKVPLHKLSHLTKFDQIIAKILWINSLILTAFSRHFIMDKFKRRQGIEKKKI